MFQSKFSSFCWFLVIFAKFSNCCNPQTGRECIAGSNGFLLCYMDNTGTIVYLSGAQYCPAGYVCTEALVDTPCIQIATTTESTTVPPTTTPIISTSTAPPSTTPTTAAPTTTILSTTTTPTTTISSTTVPSTTTPATTVTTVGTTESPCSCTCTPTTTAPSTTAQPTTAPPTTAAPSTTTPATTILSTTAPPTTSPATTVTTVNPDVPCTEPGVYPGPQCNQYYLCLEVLWYVDWKLYNCTNGQAFNPAIKGCAPSSNCVI